MNVEGHQGSNNHLLCNLTSLHKAIDIHKRIFFNFLFQFWRQILKFEITILEDDLWRSQVTRTSCLNILAYLFPIEPDWEALKEVLEQSKI